MINNLNVLIEALNKANLKGCFNLQEATNIGLNANELKIKLKELQDVSNNTD